MNKFKLILGDWSNDGHGQFTEHLIDTNLTKSQIEKAFTVAKKHFKINTDKYRKLELNICREYEDSSVPSSFITELVETFGKPAIQKILGDMDRPIIYIDKDQYVDIWIKLLKFGCDQLNFECEFKINKDYDNYIEIGGYGLFYG